MSLLRIKGFNENLIYEYNTTYLNYKKQFYDVLILNNKTDFVKNLINGVDISTLINMPDFYISNIDLWILSIKYNIPIILLSTNPKGLKENNKILLPLMLSENNKYLFIITSSPQINKPHKYHIISKSKKLSDAIIDIYNLPNTDKNSIPETFDLLKNKHFLKKQIGDKNLNIEKSGLLTLETYINYF